MKKLLFAAALLLASFAADAQCINVQIADENPFAHVTGVSLNPVTNIVTAQLSYTFKIEKVAEQWPGKFEYSSSTQIMWSNSTTNTATAINAVCVDTLNAIISRNFPDIN